MSQRDPVRVGTAGWSVPGRYLAEFPAGDTHLERYAREFPVVEIDTSFYRHHQRATYARWAASVGEEFRFAVKTPKALTHEGNLHAGASATRDRFLAEVDGLGAKLSVLLVQLPPSLVFDETATAFFADLKRALPPTVQIACEPRNLTWSTAEANDLLIGSSVSRVAADPARWEGNALPAGDQSLAYFRLHGSPRTYYSNYPAAQLETLVHQLESTAHQSRSVWCIFDNTAHGHAIGNALSIKRRFTPPRV